MRNFVLVVAVMVLGLTARAQSISLLNLTNLTSLSNKQAADDITARKQFKLQSGEEIDGFLVETYQTLAPRNKLETVVVGKGYKLASGGVLHTVTYTSANPQDVMNLMAQTKSINVQQSFHGADAYDNIYIFDSFLYRMTVRIKLDDSRSVVEISQKQVLVE
ncbi:hypothetical protein [Mucilaginibacter auburnensis]|uniref:Uncharacterized protein n=1 Tax=Mucilaginibacter auburnensis TaxID=1457233 RepID=A0A2H9VUW4_9SPHI|nr:hypothetical protein [Mucilaginibacter auburnensis]PJJ84582.1 hypothetical protein CLV57_1596 [Mucilaginibacter auburnensis]